MSITIEVASEHGGNEGADTCGGCAAIVDTDCPSEEAKEQGASRIWMRLT